MTSGTLTKRQIMIVKVATAMAVVKTKPKDQTAKQYAKNLQTDYVNKVEKWREKAAALEREVVLLKEELTKGAASHRRNWLSETESQSQQQLDSQANSSGYETQTQMTMSQTTTSLLQNQREAHDSGCHNWLDTCPEYSNPSRYEGILERVDLLARVFQYALIHPASLVDSVSKAIEEITLALPRVLLDGIFNLIPFKTTVDVITESLSLDQSNQLPELLEKKLGDFIEAIIRALVDVDVEKDTVKNELSSLLIRLSLNERLTNLAVIRMVACVGDFGSLLRRVAQRLELLTESRYVSIGYVFAALEHVVWESPLLQTSRESCIAIKQELDDSVLFLAPHYPDFAESVWRIGALLDRILDGSGTD
ncbi:meiosis-specific protein MEI4-like [Oscarella lobularis]|uniref:meiosis-specific protein MEI4-like n=1 Tax=Oscarella lobularis TaxID=121494 RepID=UPI0033143B06